MPTHQLKAENNAHFSLIRDEFTRKPFDQSFKTKGGKLSLPLRRMQPGERFDFTITSNALYTRILHAVRMYSYRTGNHYTLLRLYSNVSVCQTTENWQAPTAIRTDPACFTFDPSPKNKYLSYPFKDMTTVGDYFTFSNSPELVNKVKRSMRVASRTLGVRFELSITSPYTAIVQRVE